MNKPTNELMNKETSKERKNQKGKGNISEANGNQPGTPKGIAPNAECKSLCKASRKKAIGKGIVKWLQQWSTM